MSDELGPFEPWWTRARRWLDDVLDATGTGPRAMVAGVALLGLLLGAGWWLTRQAPPPTESLLPLVDVSAVTTSTAPVTVVVHVAGAVVEPGVRTLHADARVIDAIDACGGLGPLADLDRVNLASRVVDGQRIFVPRLGEPVPGVAGTSDPSDDIVDLNAADAVALQALPGIGPALAHAIIEHRDRHGPFQRVEDLLAVRGIGDVKFAALRDRVRV